MEIQINSNISEYKPKALGPFTGPQLICVAAAVAIEASGVALLKYFFPSTIVSYLIPLPLVAIPLLLGWTEELFHMPLNDYIELIIKRRFTYPAFRPFKIHNYIETQEARIHAEELAQEKAEKSKEKPQKKKKEAPKDIPAELKRFD